MSDTDRKVVELPAGLTRLQATTCVEMELLSSGKRHATVHLIVTTPKGPMVIGRLEVFFQASDHARMLATGLSQLLASLPPDIARPG